MTPCKAFGEQGFRLSNKVCSLVLALLALALVACGSASTDTNNLAETVSVETESEPVPDLITPYKKIGDLELGAHLFYPEGHSVDDEAAVLVFMHGGALRRGSPAQGYEIARRITPLGIAVVSVQYRLLGTNAETLDQLMADSKSVIRWLRINADSLGIDAERIAMAGHSAGAFLTLTTGVVPGFDEPYEDTSVSSVPNALIPWSAFPSRRDDPEDSMLAEGMNMEDMVPASFVRSGLPAAMFIHGDQDPIASYEAARQYEAEYRQAGNQSSFETVEGADHFFRDADHYDQVIAYMVEFMDSLEYTVR